VIRGFVRGVFSLPRGALYLIARPSLWYLAAVPVLISVVLFVSFAVLCFFLMDPLLDRLQELPAPVHPSSALDWIGYAPAAALHWGATHAPRWLWQAVLWVLFFLVMWLTFITLVNIVAGPWNEALSARIEDLLAGTDRAPPDDLSQNLRDLARGIRHSLIRLCIFWTVYLPLLILSLIPTGVTELLFLVVGIPWSSFFVALEFADIPESRRRRGLWDKFRTVWAHRAPMMGFGVASFFLLMIPLVNLLTVPVAVTGMTLLYRTEVPEEK